jgi:hypothetical protein
LREIALNKVLPKLEIGVNFQICIFNEKWLLYKNSLTNITHIFRIRLTDSGAVIVQLVWLVGCGLDRVIEVRFWQGQDILPCFQAKSLAHPVSCSVGIQGISAKGKAGGV